MKKGSMKLGFIGTGNMAGAIMGGIIKNEIFRPEEIIGADISPAGRDRVKETYGICVTDDNREAAEKAEVLILSVKPQYYAETIAEIRDSVSDDQLIITIAPGKTLAWLEEQFGKAVKIVRTMPNTPALVGEGMTAACVNQYVTDEEKEYALRILSSFGKVEIVAEHLIDAVVAVSGSSPAFVYQFIEALADGAVQFGLPRAQAYTFAAQAVAGAAKMVLETGEHPASLKDKVCSPGGTTIAGVAALENAGFRGAVMKACEACWEKSESMK